MQASSTSFCLIFQWRGVVLGLESLITYIRGVQGLILDHDLVGSNSSNDGNLSLEKSYQAGNKYQNKTDHN